MEFLKQYLLIGVTFVVIDGLWLTLIANKFYKKYLGNLLKAKADLRPAVVFYLLYVLGMVMFALRPAMAAGGGEGSLGLAAGAGGLLGLLMYATYDLTNLSTIKGWPWLVTVVDIVWGTFVTGATVVAAYLILS
jgi:uncharacterized membrane protein